MGIDREIRFVTAGGSNSVSQVFYNNYLADSRPVQIPFFLFEKPMYYTYGGTLDYYGQDPYAIFTNLVRPPIRFVFSANTSSLSGDSYFVHEIYRLDYETHKLFSDNQIDMPSNISNVSNSNEIPNGINPPSTNAPSKRVDRLNRMSAGNNEAPQPEKFFGESLTAGDRATIQKYFNEPFLTVTASTSAITGNIYDLYLDQYAKQVGSYKRELFADKAQYFINTFIVFNVDLDKNYSNFFSNNIPGAPGSQQAWNNNLSIISTNNSRSEITSGPYAGISVIGNFFSYFIVPDKPKLEYPIAEGQLTTFTPEFRWSNGDKADSFIVQINYNTGDTGFTGTIFNYPVEKSEKNLTVSKSTIKGLIEDFSTDKNIYTFQVPMKSNKSFIYRVGNSREIIDSFNVRRNVVTFTDYYMAISQSEPIKTYVVAESDSPYVSEVAGLKTPPSLDYESEVGEYTLSGTVSGSTVTGATMTLTYPNSSFVTTTTDLLGNYSFAGLEAGTYTLTTDYRGYQQDIRSISLSGDTTLGFKIKLTWGNNVDTWGKMAGENYYT
jgi:hypothetical protein